MRYLLFLCICVICIQCKSTQFESNPPFTIKEATYTKWVGGQPGVKGTNIKIVYESSKSISFLEVFYGTSKTKIVFEASNTLYGYFTTSTPDKIIDVDPKKEYTNTVPKSEKPPFKLADNEAVLSYQSGDKIKYVKLVLEASSTPKYQ